MRRADAAWATQMGRESRPRKPLILIGIVCDDKNPPFIDPDSEKSRTAMVEIIVCFFKSILIVFLLLIGDKIDA